MDTPHILEAKEKLIRALDHAQPYVACEMVFLLLKLGENPHILRHQIFLHEKKRKLEKEQRKRDNAS